MTNVAIQESTGWIWYDSNGKDFGPYNTKFEAEDKGPVAADREEKWLRGDGKITQ